ncbi:DNA mismatch repair protein [gut metagenome]|uniref:DNA mismatch repair protein n=1 Tax=gut metagenome TaxID=749906 RepID=J9D504_9ZZZZ
MNEHLKHKGRRIIFIHGKGDGVLRQAILRELRVHYPQSRYQDASFREYGYGATMVTI